MRGCASLIPSPLSSKLIKSKEVRSSVNASSLKNFRPWYLEVPAGPPENAAVITNLLLI